MNTPRSRSDARHLRASDLRAAARLAVDATTGVTRIVEGVHQSVWDTLGVRGGGPGQTGGITGLVYQGIRGATQLLGRGADALFSKLQPALAAVDDAAPGSPAREAVLAALNGVMGDHLAASGSPFATPMTLRHRDATLDLHSCNTVPEASGKVLLMIHGLCMNDLQWRSHREGAVVDHGAALAAAMGYTPVYLRYNSGLHTSQNGRELAAQLEQLAARWPTPIEELSVVAHSMGGLLIRSACHYAAQDQSRWLERLRHIVFLGTPHHGAPLERAGNWVDQILVGTPYTAPFAMLGKLRSAGITDLRHGHLLDDDWQGHDRFDRKPDQRSFVPLPAGVACHAVAATAAAKRGPAADRLIGDGLVPLHSALGQHDDPRRNLGFAKGSQYIAYRTNHMQLLSSADVTRQLEQWLTQ